MKTFISILFVTLYLEILLMYISGFYLITWTELIIITLGVIAARRCDII